MFKRLWIVLITIGLYGCGDEALEQQPQAATNEEPKELNDTEVRKNSVSLSFYANEEEAELANPCTADIQDAAYYSIATELFYHCDGLSWKPFSIKGDKGDKGDRGLAGRKGDKGDPGANGVDGEKGDKGDTGAAGADGAQGVQGVAGSQGIAGAKGDKGDTGAAGANGANGSNGSNGADGSDGKGLRTVSRNATGAECPTVGGKAIDSWVDTDGNSTYDGADYNFETIFACNGAAGTNGTNGTDGTTLKTRTVFNHDTGNENLTKTGHYDENGYEIWIKWTNSTTVRAVFVDLVHADLVGFTDANRFTASNVGGYGGGGLDISKDDPTWLTDKVMAYFWDTSNPTSAPYPIWQIAFTKFND